MPVDTTTPLAVNVWIGEKAPAFSVPNVTVRLVRPIGAGKVSLAVNSATSPQMYVAGEPGNESDPVLMNVGNQSARARLIVALRKFYTTDLAIPDQARLVLQFHGNGKPLLPAVTTTIKELPWAVNLPAASLTRTSSDGCHDMETAACVSALRPNSMIAVRRPHSTCAPQGRGHLWTKSGP